MIFYFSGTGNSAWAARQLAKRTGDVACDITTLKELPDLDSDPDWRLSGTGERREDGGIAYEFRVYERCAGFAQ